MLYDLIGDIFKIFIQNNFIKIKLFFYSRFYIKTKNLSCFLVLM